MSPVIVAMCAIFGSFAMGAIVGVRIGMDATPYPEPLDLNEPLPAVTLLRPCAPYGVPVSHRPWDWTRDGEAETGYQRALRDTTGAVGPNNTSGRQESA